MPAVDGSSQSPARPNTWLAAALVVLVLGTILRLVHLDADPAYVLWRGYIADEGRWVEQARNLVLFGTAAPANEMARLHLLLAPLFQAAAVVPFGLFGVELGTARLVSAASSILLLVAAILFLRRRLTGPALVVVMVVLGLQPDLLFLGRVAIPEKSAMLLSFLAFAALVSAGDSRGRMFAAGFLTVLAVGFKATTAPLVPIFALVVLILGNGGGEGRPTRRLAAYLAGVIVPGFLLLVPVIVFGEGRLLGQVGGVWATLLTFVRLESPPRAVAGLVYGGVAAAISILLLGVWLMGGSLLAVGRLPRDGVRDVWIGSATWVAGWLVLYSTLDYFPGRYVFHAVVPLALNLGAGLTLIQRIGVRRIEEALEELGGWRRSLVAVWLSLPVAVLLAPTLIAAAGTAGFVINRLVHQMILVVSVHSVIAAVFMRWWRPGHVLPTLVALPLVVVALRVLFVKADLLGHAFWRPGGAAGLVAWVGLLAIAMALVALARVVGPGALRTAAGLYVAAIVTAWLAQSTPALLAPTYTIRDAGPALETMASEGQRLATVGASGVLLGTRLRYSEHVNGDALPELLVTAFNRRPPVLDTDYRLERRLKLNLGKDILVDDTVRVYRLVSPRSREQSFHPAGEATGTPITKDARIPGVVHVRTLAPAARPQRGWRSAQPRTIRAAADA